MANSPKSRGGPQPEDLHEQHGRDVHEGSAHRPEEFDAMNPARQKQKEKRPPAAARPGAKEQD